MQNAGVYILDALQLGDGVNTLMYQYSYSHHNTCSTIITVQAVGKKYVPAHAGHRASLFCPAIQYDSA